MNPLPNTARPFNPPPRLVDTRLPQPGFALATLATLARGVSNVNDHLDAIERVWAPERTQLKDELRAHGETLESSHWDWRNKANRPPNWYTLVTVECEGQAQGIMAVENLLRPSVLAPGAWVLYVDDIEAAPWNLRVPQDRRKPVAREARFEDVGTLLLAEAIRISAGAAAGGRVGLHGLAQAEAFCVRRCGMTRIGPEGVPLDVGGWLRRAGTPLAFAGTLTPRGSPHSKWPTPGESATVGHPS
jgi:hypothetical protein